MLFSGMMTNHEPCLTECEPTSPRRGEGERALIRAILEDAVRCLFGESKGAWGERKRLAADARAWISNPSDASPFSFENVCGWLDLPPGRFRAYLLEQAASGRGSASAMFTRMNVRQPGIHAPRSAA